MQRFLHVSRGRNSQARQHVLERLREAAVPPHKGKVVVIWWYPAMVIIAQRANWCQQISCLSLPGHPILRNPVDIPSDCHSFVHRQLGMDST